MSQPHYPYCEDAGVYKDDLLLLLRAASGDAPVPDIRIPEPTVTKGIIYEIHKVCGSNSGSYSAARVLLMLLGKDTACSTSIESLRSKMKRVFTKQMNISGPKRKKYLDEKFLLPSSTEPSATTSASAISDDFSAVPLSVELNDCEGSSTSGTFLLVSEMGAKVTTDVLEPSGGLVKDDTAKQNNYLSYEISRKEKHIQQLESRIQEQKGIFENLGKENTRYNPINVRNRESSKNKTIDNLKLEVEILKYELQMTREHYENKIADLEKSLKIQKASLQAEIDGLNKTVTDGRRMKSYYKNNRSVHTAQKKCDRCVKLKRDLVTFEKRLGTCSSLGEIVDDLSLRNPDRSICDNVRVGIMELLGLEVATHKIPLVIQAVSKNIFGVSFSHDDLPSQETVRRISDEGHFLTKEYIAEKVETSQHFGVNKDGTSRQKVKILETSLTLDSGEQLPLGFKRTAREDSDSITRSVQVEMEELSFIRSSVKDSSPDECKVSALEKLSFFMTDRAANEKKSNSQLIEWVNQELKAAEIQPKAIFSIHCMAHVLLAFHRYGLQSLMELQEEIIKNDNCKLGRDSNGAFYRFKKENAASRVVRMTSELIGPNGDEKNGIRDKWTADCRRRQHRSLIGDYRDNRFNGIFEVAAQLTFHKDEIIAMEKCLKTPINQKIVSVLLDLKDSRVVIMVQALALFYVKVTEPYWRLVLSKEVQYEHLTVVIQALADKLGQLPENPQLLLEDQDPIIRDFPPKVNSPLYSSAMELHHPDRKDLLLSCISSISSGFMQAIRNQLSTFLPGGEMAKLTAEELQRLRGSGLTNLVSERNFGSLDASQKRRRHATLHFHSSIHLLKTSRKNMMEWLKDKPAEERRKLLKRARKHGDWLRQKHRREEKAEKRREEQELENNESLQKKKKARELLKKAKTGQILVKQKRGKTPQQKKKKKKKQRKQAENVILPDTTGLMIDQWVGVAYNNGWWPGIITNLSAKDSPDAVIIRFLEPTSTTGIFRESGSKRLVEVVCRKFIFAVVKEPPLPVTGRGSMRLPEWAALNKAYEAYKLRYF